MTESRHPYGFALEAEGDLNGRGVWSFTQDGPRVLIRYDWKIRADKPLLRALSFVFKPVFEANHRWAMKRGEESLRLELARRRAQTTEQLVSIPAPPGPARHAAAWLWLMLTLALLPVGACTMAMFLSPATR